MTRITENAIEQTSLKWLENIGYEIAHEPDIAFDGQIKIDVRLEDKTVWLSQARFK